VSVRKPNEKIRVCVEFKKINAVTRPHPFFMPRIDEIMEAVGQATYLSTLDLTKGYYHVLMSPEDREKTAFICHVGHFETLRMPFGVRNATGIFQKLMNRVLQSAKKVSRAYMDDVVIFSHS